MRACELPAGHTNDHYNGYWAWANVQPLQERGPEPAYCGVTHPAGHGLGTCNLDHGHDGNHSSGLATWPQARSNYQSTGLAGASYEDLIRDLFERIENLEQTSAGGAATDDMFAAQERRIFQLEERIRGLERAQVYGPEPHNFSALQASMTNHTNRALTDLGSGLTSRLEEVAERITHSLRTDLAVVLDRLDPPKPPSCGAPDQAGLYTCELADGHDGRHVNGISTWPNRCGAEHPSLGVACVLAKGHTTEHRSEEGSVGFGRARWADDGAQTERASGPPAAVRCPTRFREGQCPGYAGHDGDCAAVPDPAEFPECGMDPTNMSSAGAPCALSQGHDGSCVSGPPDDYPEQNFHS